MPRWPIDLMHGVNDGLAVGADVLDAAVEIEDPVERLGRRRDVVGLGAEHDDRRADAAQIDALAVGRDDTGSRELVADEQLVGDELHLLGVEEDMPAPPFLEFKVAGRFGVDLGIEIVLLGPIGVGRVEVLEIADEPRAVELAGAEIAHQRGEPGAAEQAAGIAHGIFAVHAGPIGERRAGNDDRTEQLGPLGGDHHHRPACLAIADHRRLAVGLGVKGDDALEKRRLGHHDVLDRLARDRLGQEADEVAGMACLEGHADFALRLEPADARSVTGARIDDDEGPLLVVRP